jgi:hypothetical protein
MGSDSNTHVRTAPPAPGRGRSGARQAEKYDPVIPNGVCGVRNPSILFGVLPNKDPCFLLYGRDFLAQEKTRGFLLGV